MRWRSPIFNLISQRGWGSPSKWRASGRAIIKLSKKEPCVVHGLSVFCSSESFKKLGLPPEKKTGGKLWAGPPSLRVLGHVRAHFYFDLYTDSSSDSLDVSLGLLYNWLSNRCTSRVNISLLPFPPWCPFEANWSLPAFQGWSNKVLRRKRYKRKNSGYHVALAEFN